MNAFAKLTTRLRAGRLDKRLLLGEPPSQSPDISMRGAELVDPAHRRRVAASLRRLIAAAHEPHPRVPTLRLVVRGQVLETRAELLALARELEDSDPVRPRGVIMASRLVTKGTTSPAYAGADGSLEQEVKHARAALHLG